MALEPITRQEQLLSAIATGGDILSPVTREEMYLAYLAGDTSVVLPEPITRKEQFLYQACLNGGGGTEITDGIVVKARDADGFATEVDFYGTVVQQYQFGIGNSSYSYCFAHLQKINFKNNIAELGVGAFRGVGRFASGEPNEWEFPYVTHIPDSAFNDSWIVSKLTFNEVIQVDARAFSGQSLKEVYLPKCTVLNNTNTSNSIFGSSNLTYVQVGSIGFNTDINIIYQFRNATQTGLTIELYTTSENVDTMLAGVRNYATNATIIIKASEDTTYNGTSYAAGETMITSTVEASA